MVKVRLDIDALRVESFDTIVAEPGRGTVRGHAGEPDGGRAASLPTYPYECTPRTICYNSCVDGCGTALCVA